MAHPAHCWVLLGHLVQFTREGKEQRFHSDVPPGTGDSFWLKPPLGWIFQKSEQVGRRQQGEGCREETSTAFGKRALVFPVNRYPMNGVRMRKEDDAGKLALLSPGPTSHQAPPPPPAAWLPLGHLYSFPSFPPFFPSFLPPLFTHHVTKL